MGIKEVYNELRSQKKNAYPSGFKYNLEYKHYLYLREKEDKEKKDITAKNFKLFEELNSLGIFKILEEFTEESISFTKDANGDPTYIMNIPWEEQFLQADVPNKFDEQWMFELEKPHLRSDTETWVEEAWITLGKPNYIVSLTEPYVLIGYSLDKTFTVRGKEIEFKGPLPKDETERLKIVEFAIAKALTNPLNEKEARALMYPDRKY